VPKLLARRVRQRRGRAASGGRARGIPSNVVLLDTGEHGTNILEFGDPAVANVFRRSVLDFLATI